MKIDFKLEGLSCEACVKLSAKRIGRLAGVSGVAIDRDSGQAQVTADRAITLAEINQTLSGTDYRAVAN